MNLNLKFYTFLHPVYPIFTCVDPDQDPYSDYGSESRKLMNADPIWILIHNTAAENIKNAFSKLVLEYPKTICRSSVCENRLPLLKMRPLAAKFGIRTFLNL